MRYIKFFKTLIFLMLLGSITHAADSAYQKVLVELKNIYKASASLSPYYGMQFERNGAQVDNLTAKVGFEIPREYTPGSFSLKIKYQTDSLSDTQEAGLELFVYNETVNIIFDPTNGPNKEFLVNSSENNAYKLFMAQNRKQRKPLEALQTFLVDYDNTESPLYKTASEVFAERVYSYNNWLDECSKKDSGLYVATLYSFEKLTKLNFTTTSPSILMQAINGYFDTQTAWTKKSALRSEAMGNFIKRYMELWGELINENSTNLDSVFVEAGKLACTKASTADGEVYGWIVDYFYQGYEAYGINNGIKMLEEHIKNPNCISSSKPSIMQYLEGLKHLAIDSLAPNIMLPLNSANQFNLYEQSSSKPHKLILFWSADCAHCKNLIESISKWYAANSAKVTVVTISVDATNEELKAWHNLIPNLPQDWINLNDPNGFNGAAATSYYVHATPTMLVLNSSNQIKALPVNMHDLSVFFK